MENENLGKDIIVPTNKTTVELLQDGTLVINTDLYFEIKRVLVEHETNGTLYYADNERPKGKWLRLGFGDYCCSNCEKHTALALDYNYCPHCGAEMTS